MMKQSNRDTLGDFFSIESLRKTFITLAKWSFIELIPKLRFFGILKLSTAIVSLGTNYLSPTNLQFFIKFIVPIIALLLMWPSHTLPRFKGWGVRWILGAAGINYVLSDDQQSWLTTLLYGSEMPIKVDTLIYGGLCLCLATFSILRGINRIKREGAYRGFISFMTMGMANLIIPPFMRRPVYPAGILERKIAQKKLAENNDKTTLAPYLNEYYSEIQRNQPFLSSSSWVMLREYVFKERNGECVDCGAIHKTHQNGKLVECYSRHIVYPGLYPELALLKENVIILCKDCGQNRIKRPYTQEEEEEIAQHMRQQHLKKQI